jgi:hypothetical protein
MVAVALALSGCGGGGDKAAGGAAGGASTAAAAGGTSTGVAECDDYLSKVQACISSKVPEAQRGMINSGLEATKKSWAAISDKGALAQACKMASDQAKATYAAYGCTL